MLCDRILGKAGTQIVGFINSKMKVVGFTIGFNKITGFF